jgi:hypothetical protein
VTTREVVTKAKSRQTKAGGKSAERFPDWRKLRAAVEAHCRQNAPAVAVRASLGIDGLVRQLRALRVMTDATSARELERDLARAIHRARDYLESLVEVLRAGAS